MASERILKSGLRPVLFILSIISFIAAGFLAARTSFLSAFLLIVLGIIFLWLIFRMYNAANEAVSSFFDSLRNDDTTIQFQSGNQPGSLKRLYDSMNLLNSHFQSIRMHNEYNETYYRTLIQHASTGLLVLNSENRIDLINRAACSFAGISPESKNVDLLRIRHPAFYEAICNLKPGENLTYRNLVSNQLQLLNFRATLIRRNEETLKLVSIQDIRSELESKELESYRKLMSVMTHEIMNLLTPLTTVAKELFSMFFQGNTPKEVSQIDGSTIKATLTGLTLIDEQSTGLLNFVSNYRKISKLPQPEFGLIDAGEWADQLKIAFDGKMKENQVYFTVSADKSLRQVVADKKLLNQVLINLINNSLDAVMEIEHERRIEIHIMKGRPEKVLIKITNNGPLIPPGLQEKIFVPFFTTKKNGSGIGLSISQEIMKLHNGSLVVVSSEETGTSFILEF
jgi:two-component system, NtrC family, nitrogen regulation sensor histidine kinase NtrY